jgi:hypothetical protein
MPLLFAVVALFEPSGGVVAYREFIDDTGTFWRVWDTYPVAASTLRTVSPAFANGWLTFESAAERRRLAPIPADWEFASRDDISGWCADAARVRSLPEARANVTR